MNLKFTTSLPYTNRFLLQKHSEMLFQVSNWALLADLEQFWKDKLKLRKCRKNISFIFDASIDNKCWLRNFLSSSWLTIHFIVTNKEKQNKDVISCKVSSALIVILESGMGIFFKWKKGQLRKYQMLQEVDFWDFL